MNKRSSLSTALTLLALAATLPAVPAHAARSCPPAETDAAREVSYRLGDLSEAVLRIPVPVERVRALVPRRYRLLDESTGTATLLAAHADVAKLQIECGRTTQAVVAEYGVMVESPDGTPGRHAYYLWQLSDDPQLVARMRMLGLRAAERADGDFAATPAPGGAVDVLAHESWNGERIGLAATATEPAAGPTASTPGVRFWFEGPRGTVRIAYECPDCRPRTPASGRVWGSEGSALDAILGGAARVGSGFFIRTDLVATAELIDRAPRR